MNKYSNMFASKPFHPQTHFLRLFQCLLKFTVNLYQQLNQGDTQQNMLNTIKRAGFFLSEGGNASHMQRCTCAKCCAISIKTSFEVSCCLIRK